MKKSLIGFALALVLIFGIAQSTDTSYFNNGVFKGGTVTITNTSAAILVGTENLTNALTYGADATTSELSIIVDNAVKGLLSPTVIDLNTPYIFDTSVSHSGGLLFSSRNNTTNKAGITWDGALTISGKTNRITDSGTALQYNGATIVPTDSNSNLSVNNLIEGFATTATSAGTTTLTVASKHTQYFTGSTTHTVVLPVTSTLAQGFTYLIHNESSGAVTVQSSGANTIVVLAAGTSATFICVLTSGTSAASWDYDLNGVVTASGKSLTVNNSLTLSGTDATTMTFPTTSQTIPGLSQANIWSVNGAASTPAAKYSGTPFSGTGTTSFPLLYLNDSTATASTTLNTAGTYLGVNGHGTADLANLMVDGVTKSKLDSAGSVLASDGSFLKPGFAFVSNPNTGFINSSGRIVLCAAGGYLVEINGSANYFTIDNNVGLVWSATIDTATPTISVGLFRDADGVLQLGKDAASPIAQTLKSADGSGTDKDASSLTTSGGQSTGTGRGGAVITKTSLTSTTGSSANSYSTRTYQEAKFVNLTEATATLFSNIALASSKYLGATIVATVTANDGTDFQTLTSTLNVSAVNKGGTVTTQLTQVDGTVATSSGTLTPVTYTAVANGNGVDLKCAATSSLTQTVLRVKWMITALNTDDVGTVTSQ